jgi:hypothetical protein
MAAEESIRGRILLVRGHKVMLDSDLAEVYGVAVKRLNEQVKRNRRRFPADFMFQLTAREASVLRSQFATSKTGRGGRRSRPYAFTEHGAVMLASVLNSVTAIGASILVVRAFVRLRVVLAAHKDLARKLDALQEKYDSQFQIVFEAIRELMQPPSKPQRRIGFKTLSAKSAVIGPARRL